MTECSHQWIDPEDAPIARAPYSPVMGGARRQMKPGRLYRCATCGGSLLTPEQDEAAPARPQEP